MYKTALKCKNLKLFGVLATAIECYEDAMSASKKAYYEKNPEAKLANGNFCRGKTWKLVNGKRVWMEV